MPGFGDPHARVLIVGLAPAAHGALRTGRMFTGDQSGLWLYRALHRAGFANQPESQHREDGLILNDVFVTVVARCAPPDNRPLPAEILNCQTYLEAEINIFSEAKIFIALGGIAAQALWKELRAKFNLTTPKPPFSHNQHTELPGDRHLIFSYHPSQQNTFTRRLTEPMFDQVFEQAQSLLHGGIGNRPPGR